jgi:hypothetical protein
VEGKMDTAMYFPIPRQFSNNPQDGRIFRGIGIPLLFHDFELQIDGLDVTEDLNIHPTCQSFKFPCIVKILVKILTLILKDWPLVLGFFSFL